MQLSPQHSPDDSPAEDESFDLLVSKHLIPPPLMLLPKPVNHKAKSLMPMLTLPPFIGIIPNFQPLDKPVPLLAEPDDLHNWIGEAFHNIVYRRYGEESYAKIDNCDHYWNIWACDISRLGSRKQDEAEEDSQQSLAAWYTPLSSEDKTLVFESRFECGNLSLASKVAENEYNLLLQNDINTNSYSQWFFFKVSNTRRAQRTAFKILNQYRQCSLYRQGMRIVVYSKKESELRNVSWHRAGENIQYYENGYTRSTQPSQHHAYYTLAWDYTFPHDYDDVYFAYNYPFTYGNLESILFRLETDPSTRLLCQRSSLCMTLAGNRVDLLTITEAHPFREVDKAYVVITARVHPGETVSSFVCNGIVEFLMSSSEKARQLRQHFIFKIVPMLNPDGVIHGNYRTNISGYDLNQKWASPSKSYQPEIYYLKKCISGLQEMGEVLLFCDLHGHSMKKNAFVYGCHDLHDPRKGKVFPLLISHLFRGFSFKDCSFVDHDQQGTLRSVLSRQLDHCDVYALESSFCGPEHEDIHFTVRHFEELGEKFCEALLLYFRDKVKEMQVVAAMRQDCFFPAQDSSFDSLPEYCDLDEVQLNSDDSQGGEQEEEAKTVLEDKTIKKYLMLRFMRPITVAARRQANLVVRKTQSKDFRVKLGDYVSSHITQSTSPKKRQKEAEEQAREASKKTEKLKITLRFTEKKQIHAKMFEPIDMVPAGKRQHKSTQKLASCELLAQRERGYEGAKSGVKLVLNKNYEFNRKEEDGRESVFRNNCLKNLREGPVTERPPTRKTSDFVIRKKLPHPDDKNSVSLFNSVLSSLRRDKK